MIFFVFEKQNHSLLYTPTALSKLVSARPLPPLSGHCASDRQISAAAKVSVTLSLVCSKHTGRLSSDSHYSRFPWGVFCIPLAFSVKLRSIMKCTNFWESGP